MYVQIHRFLFLICYTDETTHIKDVFSYSGFKKSIFFTYLESIMYWEYTVKSFDRNMKYLRSYST